MEMKISILILILSWIPQKKLNSLSQSVTLRDFQNQKYRFTISKTWSRLAEKQEVGEEHRQLQSVVRFMQTQLFPRDETNRG